MKYMMSLGLIEQKNGAIFGWIYNEDSPEGHIDFGITLIKRL